MELLIRVPTFRTLRNPGACLALLLLLGFRLAAQSAGEYELKAAFLYKFASFVEWPDAVSNGPLCIEVLGQHHRYTRVDSRFGIGERLERALAGQNLQTPRHAEFHNAYELRPTLVERSAAVTGRWRF